MSKKSKWPNEGARLLAWYFMQPDSMYRGELAECIGMAASSVAPVLKGRRRPTLDQAMELEDLIKIPMRAWAQDAKR
jgi:plasmid maintenance system antidote protein VapI